MNEPQKKTLTHRLVKEKLAKAHQSRKNVADEVLDSVTRRVTGRVVLERQIHQFIGVEGKETNVRLMPDVEYLRVRDHRIGVVVHHLELGEYVIDGLRR